MPSLGQPTIFLIYCMALLLTMLVVELNFTLNTGYKRVSLACSFLFFFFTPIMHFYMMLINRDVNSTLMVLKIVRNICGFFYTLSTKLLT